MAALRPKLEISMHYCVSFVTLMPLVAWHPSTARRRTTMGGRHSRVTEPEVITS